MLKYMFAGQVPTQARSFKLGLEETPLCNCELFVSLFEQALPTSTAPEYGSTSLKYFSVDPLCRSWVDCEEIQQQSFPGLEHG